MAHDIYLPEKVAGTAAVQLSEALTLPNFFQKETLDAYKGAKNGTVDVKVEGILPWRTYPWKQDAKDRTNISFDEYSERTVGVTLGGHMYSGVQLTDEQKDMDEISWAFLTGKQSDAVADGINYAAADFAVDSDNYDVAVDVNSEVSAFKALIQLRKVARAMHMPGNYTLAMGSDWEAALLNDDRLNLASNVGDSLAQSAVQEANLGKRLGFNIVVVEQLPSDAAVVFGAGMIFANAAPSLPESAPFKAKGSNKGVSLRVIRHYNHLKFIDESVVDTFYGFRAVKDVLGGRLNNTDNFLTISKGEYNVRCLKATLDSATVTAKMPTINSNEFAGLTGLTTADLTIGTAPAGA